MSRVFRDFLMRWRCRSKRSSPSSSGRIRPNDVLMIAAGMCPSLRRTARGSKVRRWLQLLLCLWIGRDDAPGAIHEAADLPSEKKKMSETHRVCSPSSYLMHIFFSTQEGGLNPLSCFCSFMLKIRSVPSERGKKTELAHLTRVTWIHS